MTLRTTVLADIVVRLEIPVTAGWQFPEDGEPHWCYKLNEQAMGLIGLAYGSELRPGVSARFRTSIEKITPNGSYFVVTSRRTSSPPTHKLTAHRDKIAVPDDRAARGSVFECTDPFHGCMVVTEL